jgi:hypothetical protein
MKRIFLLLLAALPLFVSGQNVAVTVILNATEGGFHVNMPVTLVDTISKASYKGKTDANGKATISVPPNAIYDLLIPNYTARKLIRVPNAPGASMTSTLFYSRDMVQEEKSFAMDDAEKKDVDDFVKTLPDTTWFRGTNPFASSSETYYSKVELILSDLHNGPLTGETATLVGRKSHKAFKGVTDSNGKLLLYLPKGDNYDLSFYYHKNFEYTECKYSKGTSEIQWSFEYIGTKAYAKQKKDEEERQKAEIAAQKAALAQQKVADSLNALKIGSSKYDSGTNRFAGMFERNQFKNPLVICDASSSMSMVMDDLQAWFSNYVKTNPTSQFVFFNDGDLKKHEEKKVGETGGIYYTPSLPLDKLIVFMRMVYSKGKDDDSEDNYMEALIKGTKMAQQPYGDIILIVDNHATVSDMSLLSQFNKPVHVVVFCSIKGGCDHSFCQPDYLKIAWKTKGTLHIDGLDYNDIGKMKEGETINVTSSNTTYKLLKGEFFQVN